MNRIVTLTLLIAEATAAATSMSKTPLAAAMTMAVRIARATGARSWRVGIGDRLAAESTGRRGGEGPRTLPLPARNPDHAAPTLPPSPK